MIPVALLPCPDYDSSRLLACVDQCCRAAGLLFRPGDTILVKPNLVSARNAHLSCTHPSLIRAVCLYLLDHHAKVRVGDSPAFGSARQVAKAAGLFAALADLPVPVVALDKPVRRSLECGISIGISRTALETNLLFNVPKLKAHGQLFITAAVKNLFGCVTGMRKALAHMRHGQDDRLAELIIDLMPHLPPTVNIADAITAMQQTGPVGGIPCELGLMAASGSALALDTALYTALGVAPAQVPLWRVASNRHLPGSRARDIAYPVMSPEELRLPPFRAPDRLNPVGFHPRQIARSLARRVWLRLAP